MLEAEIRVFWIIRRRKAGFRDNKTIPATAYRIQVTFFTCSAFSRLSEKECLLRSKALSVNTGLLRAVIYSAAVTALILLTSEATAAQKHSREKGKGWVVLKRAFGDLYDYHQAGLDSFHCEFTSTLYETGKQKLFEQYRYKDNNYEALDSVKFTFGYSPREFFRIGYAPYKTTGHMTIDNGLIHVISTVLRTSQNALYTWAFYGSPEVAQHSFVEPELTESPGMYELTLQNPKIKGSSFKVFIDKRNYRIMRTEVIAENVHDIIEPVFEERDGKKVLTAMEIKHNDTHTINIHFSYHEVDGFLLPLSASIQNKGRITSTNYMMHFLNYQISGTGELSRANDPLQKSNEARSE